MSQAHYLAADLIGILEGQVEGNRERDRRVGRLLKAAGWRVLRIWEHELKRRDEPRLVRRLNRMLGL